MENSASAKPVILIVDDAPGNIQLLAQLLQDDYRIIVATEGQRCLELVHADPVPDLIMLDIEMPGLDGYEICRRLQADEKLAAIPIIFITARDQSEDEEYGFQLGAVDYITKPFQPAIVEARVRTHITIKRQSDQLHYLAMRDQLTGLYNRHYLMDIAPRKLGNARRHAYPLSLMVIDIDYFKTVNDRHGHCAGDKVLQAVAGLLAGCCRTGDVVARFGGEEFVVFLDHCGIDAAAAKAEQLRLAVAGLRPAGLEISASFGVAQLQRDDQGFDDLFSRADAALYRAKAGGRNCVARDGKVAATALE